MESKNFKTSPFQLNSPKLTSDSTHITIQFFLHFRDESSCDLLFYEFIMIDHLRNKYSTTDFAQYCSSTSILHPAKASLLSYKKNLIPTDSKFKLIFFSSKQIKYVVTYEYLKNGSLKLDSVKSDVMTYKEMKIYSELKEDSTPPVDTSASTKAKDIPTLDIVKETAPVPTITLSSRQASILHNYQNTLQQECNYLRNEMHIKKNIVTDGMLISSTSHEYAYQFTLESELYLTDNASVKLYIDGLSLSCSVLQCENFEITLLTPRKLDVENKHASISVDSWKLLEALSNNLNNLSPKHEIAWKLLLEGPTLATNAPIQTIPKGQEYAMKMAQSNDITLIWGPPGTGKTYTLSSLVLNLIKRKKSVDCISQKRFSRWSCE